MSPRKPRLGFLGLGWIGQSRLEAIVKSGVAEVAAVADVAPAAIERALALAPAATVVKDLPALIETAPDGIVIATPSALHADQSLLALERGIAVFCQKPLGRNAEETMRVVDAARREGRLLGVDLSYRCTHAMMAIREHVRTGELGDVYAANVVFHNAYGPDKPWFYDRKLSGGGALMDLGTHMLDLTLWVLEHPRVDDVRGRLFCGGAPVATDSDAVEDYALAQVDFATGAALALSCSWKLHAGCDCVIEAAFYGTRGGARFYNLGGSFYDFGAESFNGTSRRTLVTPPDEWSGRAIAQWAERLAVDRGFDSAACRLVDLAALIDGIYERGRWRPSR